MQWRLHRAIELLSEGRTVGETAFELSFSSDSAFVDFLKTDRGDSIKIYAAVMG